MFFFSCEDEEDICTGNATADLIVGTWQKNSSFFYYPNGDLYYCYNCNSANSLCLDAYCVTFTYNCDWTALSNENLDPQFVGGSWTWSYDPEEEMIMEMYSEGPLSSYITTLNSVHMVMETEIPMLINENLINILEISAFTRIN